MLEVFILIVLSVFLVSKICEDLGLLGKSEEKSCAKIVVSKGSRKEF